jgi:hypothetical protein
MPRSQSSHKPSPKGFHTSTPPVPFQNPLSSVANPVPRATFGQTLKEGLAFGTGQAVAHRMVGSLFGTTVVPSQNEVKLPCDKERNAFETCMKTKSVDDFCGEQQMAYTQCIRLEKKD